MPQQTNGVSLNLAFELNTQLPNFINGKYQKIDSKKDITLTSPHDGKIIGQVPISSKQDVEAAIEACNVNKQLWQSKTVKDRVQVLVKYLELIKNNTDTLTQLIVLEHGKNILEAQQEIAKGNETTEWAIGLPEASRGGYLEVSRGVSCREERRPLGGVVVTIVPFNFPFMVPHWTLAISLAMGNCVVLKPSEKVPLTMLYTASLLQQAGLPDGVFNIVNGDASTVDALLTHPQVSAFTFVGSTPVANLLSTTYRKKAICLGGAKNHLVAHPDCNIDMTANDVVASFTGCSGQRCMAASVLLMLGEQPELLEAIISKAKALKPGSEPGQIGPVIDQASLDRITGYIDDAEKTGVKVLLDGRGWKRDQGYWIGPTILLHTNKNDAAMRNEIFGPVLSIYTCSSSNEALEIENSIEFGNAACIYTSSGGVADYFTKRFTAGMIGVNVGVPVPREPFSFGGIGQSKFGTGQDITGKGAMEFFSVPIKISTKWAPPADKSWMS